MSILEQVWISYYCYVVQWFFDDDEFVVFVVEFLFLLWFDVD